jgi:alanine racemase
MQHRHTYLSAVDPGSMLYGVPQRLGAALAVPLAPAFRALKARLISVKDLTPRARFAAEAPFPVPTPMRLGVIPLGTADWLGQLHDGRALVRGRSVPIVTVPSLELTRIDLTRFPMPARATRSWLVGRQGDAEITPRRSERATGLRRTPSGWPCATAWPACTSPARQVVSIRTRLGATTGVKA